MMTGLRKSQLLLIMTLAFSLGIASFAWAGPGMSGGCGMGPGMMGPGMGHGMGMMNLTPEQAGKAFDARLKFMNDTAELRRQMLVKRADLRELWQAKEPDKAKIEAKQKEINTVRDQLQEKATAFKLEMRKQFPAMAGGQGMGACPMMAPTAEGAKK
jgi:zinc resistance-associated protein